MSAEDETLAELISALDASHYGISEAGTCHGCDEPERECKCGRATISPSWAKCLNCL